MTIKSARGGKNYIDLRDFNWDKRVSLSRFFYHGRKRAILQHHEGGVSFNLVGVVKSLLILEIITFKGKGFLWGKIGKG